MEACQRDHLLMTTTALADWREIAMLQQPCARGRLSPGLQHGGDVTPLEGRPSQTRYAQHIHSLQHQGSAR